MSQVVVIHHPYETLFLALCKRSPLKNFGRWIRRSTRVQREAYTHEVTNKWLVPEHAGFHDLASPRLSALMLLPLSAIPALAHESTRKLKKGAMASKAPVTSR